MPPTGSPESGGSLSSDKPDHICLLPLLQPARENCLSFFFLITTFYCSISKGQISEADEDRAAFPCEMLQLYSFVSYLILHAETKIW